MHQSSLDNLRECYRRHIAQTSFEQKSNIKILDIGGANVNGSFADVFTNENMQYIAADMVAGDGVDVVLDDPYVLPYADGEIDIVLSGQMIEHCAFFWKSFAEMVRVVSKDGFIILIAPSDGPIHDYPVDCYRFYPDSYDALAQWTDCTLLDRWLDHRGLWKDLVGVFRRNDATQHSIIDNTYSDSVVPSLISSLDRQPELMRKLHETIHAKNYWQLGLSRPDLLTLSSCNTTAVGQRIPADILATKNIHFVDKTTHHFLSHQASIDDADKADLILLDGRQRFETAMLDFMNAEAIASNNAVIVINNLRLPTVENQICESNTGQIVHSLEVNRVDLQLDLIDTGDSASLIISTLDSKNNVLSGFYDLFAKDYITPLTQDNASAIQPITLDSSEFQQVIGRLDNLLRTSKNLRRLMPNPKHVVKPLISLAPPKPKLSIIVIAYNMARELPRTVQSLSTSMQLDLKQNEYEVIVVDNGSSNKFDKGLCKQLCPNIRYIDMPSGRISPCHAINTGIAAARSDFVGVMIDGARMASPRLLASAIDVASLDEHAVIGTLSFHLGSQVQNKAMLEGYDQKVEDTLLNSVAWQDDGYRLFDISVPANSSREGWFTLPDETNALFMHKQCWYDLDGFDEAFDIAGGGLANLDTWKRACELADNTILMLLGEATFHQFHGGVATNAVEPKWPVFNQHYASLRGAKYTKADITPLCVGKLNSKAKSAVERFYK